MFASTSRTSPSPRARKSSTQCASLHHGHHGRGAAVGHAAQQGQAHRQKHPPLVHHEAVRNLRRVDQTIIVSTYDPDSQCTYAVKYQRISIRNHKKVWRNVRFVSNLNSIA